MSSIEMYLLFCFCSDLLGSIPDIPARSCAEIKAKEQGKAVSGKYWLNPQETKMVSNKFLVTTFFCKCKCSSMKVNVMLKNNVKKNYALQI